MGSFGLSSRLPPETKPLRLPYATLGAQGRHEAARHEPGGVGEMATSERRNGEQVAQREAAYPRARRYGCRGAVALLGLVLALILPATARAQLRAESTWDWPSPRDSVLEPRQSTVVAQDPDGYLWVPLAGIAVGASVGAIVAGIRADDVVCNAACEKRGFDVRLLVASAVAGWVVGGLTRELLLN